MQEQDDIQLFNETTYECSRLITKKYSTSFTLGIKTLSRDLQLYIFGIYGYVRFADEIVDTFHDHDKLKLLTNFKKETFEAIDTKLSFNPVLHAFQLVVNKFKIDHDLIHAFLTSMEMDIENKAYGEQGYKEYIYGSAEVVGLMCLRVFLNGDDAAYERLKPSACSLGAAFQKVNFLRDIKADFQERGRTYFPKIDFKNFTTDDKKAIEKDIQKDFDHAFIGIKQLPNNSKTGVYLAYVYYLKLFEKIKGFPASKLVQERVRIPDNKKLTLLMGVYLQQKMKVI